MARPKSTAGADADTATRREQKSVLKRQRVTIRDVAAAAGVSPMTVSNVINSKTGYVGEETRRRVMKAIEALDYRLLSSGRNLRLGNRQAIGVVIVDESEDFLSHPFISRMVSGLCGVLNRNGYAMTVQGISPDDFSTTFGLRRADADAYCIRLHGSRARRAAMLETLERLREPAVLIQETLAATTETQCVVRQDDYGGGRMMADHLAARGVEHLWVVVPRFSGPMTESRLKGLRDGFGAAHREVKIESVVCDANSFESAHAAVGQLLAGRERPSAIVGINDELALAGLRALQDHAVKVPRDVLVAGFNGFHAPGYARPNLTTIVSCPTEIGSAAARSLLDYLKQGFFPHSEIVLPVAFRLGESS
jgi:DNA-binding LacI/PurR family transcriptional regulator